MKPRILPNGLVVDGSQQPIPGAKLRMRDQSGRVSAEIASDSAGRFQEANLSQATLDGYGLAQVRPRTGSGTLYVFAPLGTQSAVFCDTAGRSLPRLSVAIQQDAQEPLTHITDKNGTITLHNIPLCTRLRMRILNSHQVVSDVHTTLRAQMVHYAVTVTSPATIQGHVLSVTGLPLKGYKPFATVGPDVEHHNRLSARWLLTSTDGNFQIVGLPPGTYYVTAAQTYHPIASVQRVVIAAGQTKNVTLRVSL